MLFKAWSKKDITYWKKFASHVVAFVLGFAVYGLIRTSIEQFLVNRGFVSITSQYWIMIIGAVFLLWILGFSGKKIVDAL